MTISSLEIAIGVDCAYPAKNCAYCTQVTVFNASKNPRSLTLASRLGSRFRRKYGAIVRRCWSSFARVQCSTQQRRGTQSRGVSVSMGSSAALYTLLAPNPSRRFRYTGNNNPYCAAQQPYKILINTWNLVQNIEQNTIWNNLKNADKHIDGSKMEIISRNMITTKCNQNVDQNEI